jgi:ribosomal protein S18 acetylase RimI-like enzyme
MSLRADAMEAGHVAACAAIVGRLPLFEPYGYGEAAARRDLERALAEGRADLRVALDEDDLGSSRRGRRCGKTDLGSSRRGRRCGKTEMVAGFAWLVPRGAFDRSGYLRLIAVDDRRQGQGVGQLLINDLEERHLARGGIVLLAAAANAGAHRFYERLGYVEVGLLCDYVKPGLDERIYYKPPR